MTYEGKKVTFFRSIWNKHITNGSKEWQTSFNGGDPMDIIGHYPHDELLCGSLHIEHHIWQFLLEYFLYFV